MADSNVVWFADLGFDDLPQVGGKNASLGEMMRAAGRWWLGGRTRPKVEGRAAQGASEVVR